MWRLDERPAEEEEDSQPAGEGTDVGWGGEAEEASRDTKKGGGGVVQLHFNLVKPQS